MQEEAKKVTLTIGERVAALRILNAFKGDMPTLSAILTDVKQFPVSDEEWTEAKLVKTPAKDADGNDSETWKWEDEIVNKEISIQKEVSAFIKGEIKRKGEASELTTADAALIALNSKL